MSNLNIFYYILLYFSYILLCFAIIFYVSLSFNMLYEKERDPKLEKLHSKFQSFSKIYYKVLEKRFRVEKKI